MKNKYKYDIYISTFVSKNNENNISVHIGILYISHSPDHPGHSATSMQMHPKSISSISTKKKT